MGTSLVLEVLGRTRDPKEGVALAAAAIDDGEAAGLLDRLGAHFGTA